MSTSRRCSGRLIAQEVSQNVAVDSDVDLDDKVEQMGSVDAKAAKKSQEAADRNGREEHEDQDTYARSSTAVTRPVKKKARLTTASSNQESIQSDPEQIELDASEAVGESTSNSKSVKPEQKVSPSLAHFLKMPLDILAEICSHLPVETIIELCRTSKGLRSILLSRGGRSVWVVARQRNGLPRLEHHDLDEVQYAMLLFGSQICHLCNGLGHGDSPYLANSRRRLDHFIVACDDCFAAHTFMVPSQKTRWTHYHPEAPDCVLTVYKDSTDEYWNPRPTYTYVRQDLELVSVTLRELEAADASETEAREVLRLRSQGNKSRRAQQEVDEEWDLSQLHTARVQHFVEERQRLVIDQKAERESVREAFNQHQAWVQMEAALQRHHEWELKEQAKEKRDAELRSKGWTRTHLDLLNSDPWRQQAGELPCPTENDEGWMDLKDSIDAELVVREQRFFANIARRELEYRQRIRKTFVREKHDKLKDAHIMNVTAPELPSYGRFLHFKSVKPFWEPDPKIDVEVGSASSGPSSSTSFPRPDQSVKKWQQSDPRHGQWRSQFKAIVAEIKAHAQQQRIDAIRQILAATSGEKIDLLSTDVDDYDEKTYGGAFFSRITSHFIVEKTGSTRLESPVARTYPHVLKHDSQPKTSALRVRTIRAILKLGNLDEDTATTRDLDKLGKLSWLDGPALGVETPLWTWPELVAQITHWPHRVKGPIRIVLAKDVPVAKIVKAKRRKRQEDDDDEEYLE